MFGEWSPRRPGDRDRRGRMLADSALTGLFQIAPITQSTMPASSHSVQFDGNINR